jgi:hypothetical protein
VEKMSDPSKDDSAVLAYRVGQLEKTFAEGFQRLEAKIDDMTHNFVTKNDLMETEQRNTMEHSRLEGELDRVEIDVREIQEWMKWITRIVIGAVVAAVLAIIGLKV